MARGNEAQQAAEELRATMGDVPNGESVLRARDAIVDQLAIKASMHAINEEATADLDTSKIPLAEGETFVEAKVRGDYVSYIVVTTDGTHAKRALLLDDLGKSAKKLSAEEKKAAKDAEDAAKAAEKAEEERLAAEKEAEEAAAAKEAADKEAADKAAAAEAAEAEKAAAAKPKK